MVPMPGAGKAALSIGLSMPDGHLVRKAQSEPRLRLKSTPASLPLPVTRRGEREPAKQPSQRLFNLAIAGGPRPLGLVRGRINPVGRTPDANIDALLRSINAPAVLASPDDHGLRGRTQLIITAPICGPETSQRRARQLLKCLVRDPPLAREWLSTRQLPNNSPEPLDANTTGRRCRRQLVVIAAADELKPALAAGPLAALILPHRPAANAARDRQATGRLHGVNISSALASGVGRFRAARRDMGKWGRGTWVSGRTTLTLTREEAARLIADQQELTGRYQRDAGDAPAGQRPPG